MEVKYAAPKQKRPTAHASAGVLIFRLSTRSKAAAAVFQTVTALAVSAYSVIWSKFM
jgi:hypothetical protein